MEGEGFPVLVRDEVQVELVRDDVKIVLTSREARFAARIVLTGFFEKSGVSSHGGRTVVWGMW